MNQIFFHSVAAANIKGEGKNAPLSGQVRFYQKKDYVLVQAMIRGLPETESGFFGFHIHEGSDCGGTDFGDTGSHLNPENLPHPKHVGDLPPLLKCGDFAYLTVATDRFALPDIIGKTVVIHNMPDDFTTQPAGNAGTKIACGVIMRM